MITGQHEDTTPDRDDSSGEPNASRQEPPANRRLIGRIDGAAGPRLILIAGVHGNEPAGVIAATAVLDRLERERIGIRGELIALRGNVRALRSGQRYMDRDLNRLWTGDRVASLRTNPTRAPDDSADAEELEQFDLLHELDSLIDTAPDGAVIVDLHSTSGPGAPFACISDTLRSRAIALALPVPLVLGVEEAIEGTLLEHFESEGVPMVLLEGGQHNAPDTEHNLESALWLILRATGLIRDGDVPDLALHRDRLRDVTESLPRVVEVTHRHELSDEADFRMRNGLAHFDAVQRGQPLADDAAGPVTAPADGLLIMPRYQIQGSDGFFIGRPVRRSWLSVSSLTRAARIDQLLPHLPGVTRDPTRSQRLLVDPTVARWLTVQLFHLSGFRRLPDRDGLLVFTRRIEP